MSQNQRNSRLKFKFLKESTMEGRPKKLLFLALFQFRYFLRGTKEQAPTVGKSWKIPENPGKFRKFFLPRGCLSEKSWKIQKIPENPGKSRKWNSKNFHFFCLHVKWRIFCQEFFCEVIEKIEYLAFKIPFLFHKYSSKNDFDNDPQQI